MDGAWKDILVLKMYHIVLSAMTLSFSTPSTSGVIQTGGGPITVQSGKTYAIGVANWEVTPDIKFLSISFNFHWYLAEPNGSVKGQYKFGVTGNYIPVFAASSQTGKTMSDTITLKNIPTYNLSMAYQLDLAPSNIADYADMSVTVGGVGQSQGVPEPESWALMVIGLFLIGGVLRSPNYRSRSTS